MLVLLLRLARKEEQTKMMGQDTYVDVTAYD